MVKYPLTIRRCSCYVLHQQNAIGVKNMNIERILNEVAAVTALFAGTYVLLMVA